MWKNIYHQLNHAYQSKISVKDYCKYFLSIVEPSETIMSISEVNDCLKNNQTEDFFPEALNLNNAFNNGDYRFIASYIFYFNELNQDWYDINNNLSNLSENEKYKIIFKEGGEDFILTRAIFSPELLLSANDENRKLTFLFLLFLPGLDNYQMLFHYKKKIPLLCSFGITDENFDMLLFLTNKYLPDEVVLYQNKNFNHFLIEEFMVASSELYAFDKRTKWKNILPIYKMKKLFEIEHWISNFNETIDDRLLMIFPQINNILNDIEKEHKYNFLNQKLSNKTSTKDSKIQKI